MRKVILVVNTTVDGNLSGPEGELDWMVDDPELGADFAAAMYDGVDTILSGRNCHLGFRQHFGATAANPGFPAELRRFASWMVETPTVVFSSSLTDAEAGANARVAADIAPTVAELKALPGKDMVVFGGVATAQAFVELGLVDEYWLKVHPVVIGAGKPLFQGTAKRSGLTLTEAKGYPSGVVGLRYSA